MTPKHLATVLGIGIAGERRLEVHDRDVVRAHVRNDHVPSVRGDSGDQRVGLSGWIVGADEDAGDLGFADTGRRPIDVDDRERVSGRPVPLASPIAHDDVPSVRCGRDPPRTELGGDTSDLRTPVALQRADQVDD